MAKVNITVQNAHLMVVTEEPGDMTHYEHIIIKLFETLPKSIYRIIILKSPSGVGLSIPLFFTPDKIRNFYYSMTPYDFNYNNEQNASYCSMNANEIREVSNYFNQDSFVFASAIRCAFKALELGDES
jgi:hypothetical protein